jgi:hypothetical protein
VLVDALMLRLGSVLSGRPLVSASPESAQQHLQPLFSTWTEAEADPRQAHWRKLRHAHKNAAAGAWFSSEDIVHGGGAGSTRPPPAYARRFTQVCLGWVCVWGGEGGSESCKAGVTRGLWVPGSRDMGVGGKGEFCKWGDIGFCSKAEREGRAGQEGRLREAQRTTCVVMWEVARGLCSI